MRERWRSRPETFYVGHPPLFSLTSMDVPRIQPEIYPPARSPVTAVGCLAHTPFVFLHLDFNMFSSPSSFAKVHRTFRRF